MASAATLDQGEKDTQLERKPTDLGNLHDESTIPDRVRILERESNTRKDQRVGFDFLFD